MKRLVPTQSLRAVIALLAAAGLTALALGCGATAPGDPSGESGSQNGGNNSTAVGQGGAQDFGRFRGIVESGDVPDPETLSPVGFFAEHRFKLPEPQCGEDVCMHGMFGVQGNMINGSNCTTVAIGFNTTRQPDSMKRPPLNLAVAVDTSGSMRGDPLNSVRNGLQKLVDELRPEDRLTLVKYSSESEVVAISEPTGDADANREELRQVISQLQAQGGTNIYRGLTTAFENVERHASEDVQNRVIMLSDGEATQGIQRRERIHNLADSYNRKNFALTSIGVGNDFDMKLMRGLGQGAANNFYYLEDPSAVTEVFVEEVKTFLVPLAEDVEVEFDGTDAYNFRAAYGVRRWSGDDYSADIEIPALFMAGRDDAEDMGPGGGRRGGGGVMLLELVPTTDPEVLAQTPAGAKVGDLTMEYTDPLTGETVTQKKTVTNPLKPDAAPEKGEFSDTTVEKAFVALNIFAGFKMATRRAKRGANGAALDILEPLRDNVDEWLDEESNSDPDIRADLELMKQLIQTLQKRTDDETDRVQRPNPNPWPRD